MAYINADRAKMADPVRPARRGVTFANGLTVQGVAEYRAFEYPAGSGDTWRLAPIGYKVGVRLAELEIEQIELWSAWKQAKERADGGPFAPEAVVPMTRQWVAWCAKAAEFCGPLMIPTWPRRRRWGFKLLRALHLLALRRNPLRNAPQNDLGEIVGFFSQCRTSSGTGIRSLSAVRRN